MLAKPSLERDREFSFFICRWPRRRQPVPQPSYLLIMLEPPALVNILGFTKSRSVDVQLAACLWWAPSTLCLSPLQHFFYCSVTNIVRASSSSSPSTFPTSPASSTSAAPSHSLARDSNNHRQPLDETCTRTVMNVVNRMLALPPSSSTISTAAAATPGETPQTKTKACFILRTVFASIFKIFTINLNFSCVSTDYLVNDDITLCHAAFDRGCLEYLAALIQSISPAEPASPEWEEDEPESISCLREVGRKKKEDYHPSILNLLLY